MNCVSYFSQLLVPRVDEIVNEIYPSTIFSLFDFTGSFYRIPSHPDTIPLTAFAKPTRFFEGLGMPIGTGQSLGWFVRVIIEVIRGPDGVEVYLADVVAFNDSPAQ